MHTYSIKVGLVALNKTGPSILEQLEAHMPNMDYPGPCLSCISDSCGLWDENYSEKKDEKKSDKKDEKK